MFKWEREREGFLTSERFAVLTSDKIRYELSFDAQNLFFSCFQQSEGGFRENVEVGIIELCVDC